MKTKKKKLLVTVIVLFLFLGALGVGISNSKDSDKSQKQTGANAENTQDESKNNEDTPQEYYNIGDNAILRDWNIQITDIKIVDSIKVDYGYFSPKDEGNKYIQFFATITNNGKQADRFLPFVNIGNHVQTKILYGDEYEFTETNLIGYRNDLHDSTINPLSSKTGEIVFEIPKTVADSNQEILLQFTSGIKSVEFKIR